MVDLVKDSKDLRVPNYSDGVKGTFNYAMKKAREQEWTRVVIHGENGVTGKGKTMHSRMSKNTAVAMVAKAQHVMLRDICDGP